MIWKSLNHGCFILILIAIFFNQSCDPNHTEFQRYQLYIFLIHVDDSVSLTPVHKAYFGNKVVADSIVIIGDSIIVDDKDSASVRNDEGNFRLPEGYTTITGDGHYMANSLYYDISNGIVLRDFIVYKSGFKIWRYDPSIHRLIHVSERMDSLYVQLSPK